MEGAPLLPVEDEKAKRFESLDVDDDSKDKKKKKKRSDASAIHSRINTEKSQELQGKRQNARKELGGLSLSGIFDKQENENKLLKSDNVFSISTQEIDTEKTDNRQDELENEEQDFTASPIEIELPGEDHPDLQTEVRIIPEEELLDQESDEDVELQIPEEITAQQEEPITVETTGPQVEDDFNSSPNPIVSTVAGSGTPQQSSSSQPYQSRIIPPAPPVPQASSGGGSNNNPPTPPTPPTPPVSPGSGQPNPNFGNTPNFNTYNQPPVPPYAGNNPNVLPPMPPNVNPNIQPRPLPTPEQRPIVIEKHNHFLAGLIVGGLYEHFKHRKREKQLKKDNERIKQDVVELRSQQFKNEEQLKKVNTELVTAQQAFEQTNKPTNEVVRPVEAPIRNNAQEQQGTSAPSRVGEIVTDTIKAAAELAAVPFVVAAEKNRPLEAPRSAEFGTTPYAAEKQQSKSEAPPQIVEAQDEPLEVAEGAHVEMSSWHRIEVDNKTGHAVENPTNAYGHEFEVEHRQEIKAEDTAAGLQVGAQAMSLGNNPTQVTQNPGDLAGQQVTPKTGNSRANNTVEETQKITQDSNGPIIGLSIALVTAVGLLIFVLL